MKKHELIEEVIDGIKNFKIIPFFGAGMSKSCGAKDWGEIINELKKELITDSLDYLEVAQEYENKYGRKKLITRLQDLSRLTSINSETLKIHLQILAMNPPVVYTTNYDNALEESANLMQKKYRKIVDLKDIVNSEHGDKQIIKFHGDFSNPNSIVFTKNDYQNRLNLERHCLDVLFRAHILGKSVLFLGYSFNDANIDYIFKKHSELYGNSNLLKSYIISFNKNEIREKQLMEKNIMTISVSSPNDLNSMIDLIGTDVFNNSLSSEIDKIFKPLPLEVLLNHQVKKLDSYLKSDKYSNEEKFNKVRETIESKSIPSDTEILLFELFNEFLTGNYDDKIKEAFLISFPNTYFKDFKHILSICFKIIGLMENPKFILDFSSKNFNSDGLMVIERKTSSLFKSIEEENKFICSLILGYLESMINEKKELPIKQLYRLFEGLKNHDYHEIEILGFAYPDKKNAQEIVDYYLNKYDSSLKARFTNKGVFGRRRPPTLSEIKNSIINNLPSKLD